ncbi:PaaI family thioesterase [Hyphomicrobium sp. 802]|uniref:PaaI family thioesterase n=1 Tax=unclassified Hyphomicrobium TaxID=2619925 RepID=UPI000213DF74|nr:Thioesterase superfamily protein [Hyphomicrobium sp. MC1]
MADESMSAGEHHAIIDVATMASMSGLQYLEAMMRGDVPRMPIEATLGFQIVEAEEGRTVFESEPQVGHYNAIATVHAGYTATLLDSSMACAVLSTLPKGTGFTTMEFKISLLRPMTKDTGLVRAEGLIMSRGRRAATAEGRLTDKRGKLIAHATTTCLVFSF